MYGAIFSPLMISNIISGRFLVAHLNAMHICDQSTARDISKELQEIKSSERGEHLDRVYDRSVRTILSGRKGSVELALRVLSWLDNARRPLFANELVIAVSIDVDQKALDPDSLPVAEKLADVCAGLIIIEENSQTARFSHYTVQEYLRRKSVVPEHLKGAYHFSVCMTHLSFDEFKKGACISSKKIRSRFGENPFFAYVSRNVSFHLKACGEINTTDYVAGFVSDLGLVSSWRQAKECTTYRPEPGRVVGLRKWKSAWNKGIMDCTSPVSAACELGHQAYLRSLIETKGISAILETGERLSPLHIAAKNGNTGVARLLIDLGADISFLSGKYQQIRPLLHLATKRRHMETVLLLIEKGAVVTAADRKGYTPLTIASKQGYEELVRLFIHNGALITPVDGLRDNALHLAANHGHKDIVRLLIDKGAIAKKPDHYGRTPFHLAAKSGGIDTIRTLVDYGAGNFEPDDEGDTPLHYAVSYADESVIRFLISMTGADVLARNKKGITPVHNCATRARFGANRYDVSFIRMIIESGDIEKNISTTTDRGETLLHLLVKSDCNEDLVRFLVDKGADINARNTLGETPLQCTTWWHRNARLLIDLGADVKVDNKSGTRTLLGSALGNALYHARWVDKIMYGEGDPSNLVDLNAHISVSRQLIANGACISGADDKGLTPLHIAAGGGGHFAEIVEMILERGADVSATDNEGCTPLHAAASHRLDNSAIIALLVSHGAEISAIDSNGKMPLHHAGCYPVARAIIDRGACVSAADSQGLLPLHHAARSAYKEVARILIEKGANISATNEDGITPLHWQSATPYANRKCLSKRAGPGINEKYEDNKLLAGFLIENGANISAVDKFGRTPLHLAAKFGNEAVVRVYVQKRLDISPLDGTGRTALQIAMKYKRISIVRLLRSATQGENPDNSEVECEGYDSDYDTELKIHRYNYKARTKYHDDSDGQLGEEYNSDRPKDPEI